ncbi:MAG: hypothetical protein AAF637_27880, partial [Pseudomonadota bacterium]
MATAWLRTSTALLLSIAAGPALAGELSDVSSVTIAGGHGAQANSQVSISGAEPVKVVVRGLGPSLAESG